MSTRARHLISKLRALYPSPRWALVSEVRSSTGMDLEVLRIADAIAVDTSRSDRWKLDGFELKVSRSDWLREIADPEKCAPIKLFCSRWWLVVPAPWRKIVLSSSELPESWGLIEVGTGKPRIVEPALERRAEEPTHDFLASLVRSLDAAGERLERDDERAEAIGPMQLITRPRLDRDHVGLACGHRAPKPLTKTLPRALACEACAAGAPADRDVVLKALHDGAPDDVHAYVAEIMKRRGAA